MDERYKKMYEYFNISLFMMYEDGKIEGFNSFHYFFTEYAKYCKDFSDLSPEARALTDRAFCIAIADPFIEEKT